MAWAEKAFDKDKKLRGYRGRYRDSAGKKQWVKDDHGQIIIHGRKRDAEYAAQEQEVKARRQAAPSKGRVPGTTTWGDWWDMLAKERTFDYSNTASYEADVVELHIRPKWGHVPLAGIKRRDVQRWVTNEELRVRPGMKASSVNRIYSVFRVSINRAMEEEILTASPCAGVKLPVVPKNRRKRRISEQEWEKLACYLREDFRDVFDFDFETGLRPGEVCGLHADHLDLDNAWIDVVHVLVERDGKLLIRPWPKDEEPRRVGISNRAISVARRHLDGRDLTTGCGIPHTDGSPCRSVLVFLDKQGKPFKPRRLYDHLYARVPSAGIAKLSSYAFRRGFATRLARGGVDPFGIADVLGHSDVEETRGYVQETQDETRATMFVALGQRPPLTVVDGGARGANDGANPDSQASPAAPIKGAENVG